MSRTTALSRRRFAPIALVGGGLATVALAASMTGTLSGFAASINNSQNTAATGVLTMQETGTVGGTTVTCNSTDGGTINTNTATCATINKYSGTTTLIPGQTVTTTINIKNTGTVAANTFSLTPSACGQVNAPGAAFSGSATDLCAKLNVVITSGGTTVFSGTAKALGTTGSASTGTTIVPFSLPTVAPGATVPFTFAVTLNSAADNTYQGLQASQPLLWSFAS